MEEKIAPAVPKGKDLIALALIVANNPLQQKEKNINFIKKIVDLW